MSEFFFWFIRPMAELLGVIAMFALVVIGFAAIGTWHEIRSRRQHQKETPNADQ